MRLRSLLLLMSCLCAPPANAGILYQVTVDTSSITGTAGSLDFNFNPGSLVTQAASLEILNFTSGGTLVTGPCVSGGPCVMGDVSGTLPGTVTFDNGMPLNDYFQGFSFGATLSFQIRLFGPAVDSPDGTSTSGSSFAFSMFSDAAGTTPALTPDPDGFAVTIDVNLDGSTSVHDFSSQTDVAPVVAVGAPEPASLVLLGPAIALMVAGLRL